MSPRSIAVIVFVIIIAIQIYLYLTNIQPVNLGISNENLYKWDREQKKQLIVICVSIVTGAVVIFALPSKRK